MNKRDLIKVSAVRTPIGAFGGSLKSVSHTDLATLVNDEIVPVVLPGKRGKE